MRAKTKRSFSQRSLVCAIAAMAIFLSVPREAGAVVGSTLNRPVNVSASIPSELTLDMRIIDQRTNSQVPSMDFGDLLRSGDEFRAQTFFKVYLTIYSVGISCVLSQTGTPLTLNSGTDTIPKGAYIAKPEFEASENSNQARPGNTEIGVHGSAAQNNMLLFKDPDGRKSVITVTYTLTGDPITQATEVIPVNQKSGAYSGTVQFTLTTV